MRKDEFVLIDFYSQQAAVLRYINGWTLPEILNWMRCYGLVESGRPEIHYINDPTLVQSFIFSPHCCYYLRTVFWFEQNELRISYRWKK